MVNWPRGVLQNSANKLEKSQKKTFFLFFPSGQVTNGRPEKWALETRWTVWNRMIKNMIECKLDRFNRVGHRGFYSHLFCIYCGVFSGILIVVKLNKESPFKQSVICCFSFSEWRHNVSSKTSWICDSINRWIRSKLDASVFLTYPFWTPLTWSSIFLL